MDNYWIYIFFLWIYSLIYNRYSISYFESSLCVSLYYIFVMHLNYLSIQMSNKCVGLTIKHCHWLFDLYLSIWQHRTGLNCFKLWNVLLPIQQTKSLAHITVTGIWDENKYCEWNSKTEDWNLGNISIIMFCKSRNLFAPEGTLWVQQHHLEAPVCNITCAFPNIWQQNDSYWNTRSTVLFFSVSS